MKNLFFQNLAPFMFALFATLPLSAQKATAPPEQMPEYPGGMTALIQYMTDNIKYPEAAKKENAEGMIVVKFTVEKDGTLSNISTANEGPAQRPDLVLEAIRVVKAMPKWTPARDKGKVVSCEMALPVKFKLS